MFITKSRSLLSHPIFNKLDSLARLSRFVQRRSIKCDPACFLLALMQCVAKGTSSLNHAAIALATLRPAAMSRQAMFNRLNGASTDYLKGVVGELLASRAMPVLLSTQSHVFKRVLVQDTTVISMAKSNAGNFPNNGNGKSMTAGVKVDLVTDLTSGKVLRSAMCNARDTDQKLSYEVLDLCRKRDLVVRDMGFFNLDVLDTLDRRGAFWLSRLPASVGARTREGLTLETILKTATGNHLDLSISLGKHAVECRLIATRLPSETAKANRRRRRSESARHGTTPKQQALLRDEWSLLVTSLPDEVDSMLIYRLYAARWGIEIQFRAFKQSCRISLGLKHKAGKHQIEALVLASMIFQLMTLELHAQIQREVSHNIKKYDADSSNPMLVSLEKLCDAFAHYLLLLDGQSINRRFAPDLRHLIHDRRKRLTLWQSITQSLA